MDQSVPPQSVPPQSTPPFDGDRAAARAAPRPLTSEALLARIVELVGERRGGQVVSLDVRKLVDYMDHLVIVSGRSNRQNRAIAQHVITQLKRESAVHTLSRAGTDPGAWICLDYVDVILHVFDAETREQYDLELLWADAERTEHGSQEALRPIDVEETLLDGDDWDDDDDDGEDEGVILPPSAGR